MRHATTAAGVVLVVAAAAGLAVRSDPEDRTPTPIGAPPGASTASAASTAPTGARMATSIPPAPAPATPAPAAPTLPVVDPRVPAIDPPSPEPAPAQPWEIADPALYKAREKRLAQEMNERFVQAADVRLPLWLAAVDEMRARNAPPADIARAEDKIRHLQAVRDALMRGEPLGHDGLHGEQPPAGIPP